MLIPDHFPISDKGRKVSSLKPMDQPWQMGTGFGHQNEVVSEKEVINQCFISRYATLKYWHISSV